MSTGHLTQKQLAQRGRLLQRIAEMDKGECPCCHRPFQLGPEGVQALMEKHGPAINALIAALYPEDEEVSDGTV
ncbi:MAG: hypothetical protein D6784_14555 [Chloroflexi bacterium]|nr:MAG: hypothetical protein D6784_14555 [Chloroflexota bacterium]